MKRRYPVWFLVVLLIAVVGGGCWFGLEYPDAILRIDALISVGLYAILAGLSLAATCVVWLGTGARSDAARPSPNPYADMALKRLAMAVFCFLLGLTLTFVSDSLLDTNKDRPIVELLIVIATGVPLTLGILYQYSGANYLVGTVLGERKRFLVPEWLGGPISAALIWVQRQFGLD